eukprot:2067739-Pyramimonas_sp.AAC.1
MRRGCRGSLRPCGCGPPMQGQAERKLCAPALFLGAQVGGARQGWQDWVSAECPAWPVPEASGRSP